MCIFIVTSATISPLSYSKPIVVVDSDGDGLLDVEEDVNRNGVVDDGETSYLLTDSDDDGFDDAMEVTHSSDPLNAGDIPLHADPNKTLCLADKATAQETEIIDAPIFLPELLQPELIGAVNLRETLFEPAHLSMRSGGTVYRQEIENLEIRRSTATGSTVVGMTSAPILTDYDIFTTNQDGLVRAYSAGQAFDWAVDVRKTVGDTLRSAPLIQRSRQSNQAFRDKYGGGTNVIYVATAYNRSDNRIYAINAKTGSILWTFNPTHRLNMGDSAGLSLDYASNTLYVTTHRRDSIFHDSVWAINTLTATTVWSANAGDIHYGRPLVRGDRVYTVNIFGAIFAFDKNNGDVLWQLDNDSIPNLSGASILRAKTGEVFIARIDFDGAVRMVRDDGEAGTLVWEVFLPEGTMPSVPTPVFGLADQYVYVGAENGKVYQIEVATGELSAERTINTQSEVISLSVLNKDFFGRAPTIYSTTNDSSVATHCFPFRRNNSSADSDLDGVLDGVDNCPMQANPFQDDADLDGLGDSCDIDADNDNYLNDQEIQNGTDPLVWNNDADGDGVADVTDNCLNTANPYQGDLDEDGIGDACEALAPEPEPEVFTVGGSVIGLNTESSLILQLNLGEQLELTIDDNFVFDTGLSTSSNYEVSIVSSNNTACTLANANGTIEGANAHNIIARCVFVAAPEEEPETPEDPSGTPIDNAEQEAPTQGPATSGAGSFDTFILLLVLITFIRVKVCALNANKFSEATLRSIAYRTQRT